MATFLLGVAVLGGWILAGTAVAQETDSQGDQTHGATEDAVIPGATVETHHEVIPNPVHQSDFSVAPRCQTSAQPCQWDDTSTWRSGSLPGANTRVIVDGNVQIDSQDAVARSVGIYPGGTLTFDQDVDTRLRTADLVVFAGSTLHVGTSEAPIDPSVQAEVIFRDIAFDPNDPTQILRGLVAAGGTVRVSGSPLGDTYLRTAIEPTADSAAITTADSMSDAGWRVGDTVTIPTSQQCAVAAANGCESQTEDRIIVSISGDTATLDEALTYDHPGARDHNGEIDFMPHVINKSRNVIFRSENPDGLRGHMLLHGRVDVDIRFTELRDMGRTSIEDLGVNNQKGRYPLHAHHLIGPLSPQANGYQFTFVGNAVDFGEENVTQGRKWGISIHGSHYGLIEGNVVDNASGAAIVTESGSESGNRISENFAVRVVGGNGERTSDLDPFDGTKSGRAGVGYWFNGGGRNSIRDNVAADVVDCTWCFGFKVDNVRSGELIFPSEQGSDPLVDGGETVDGNLIGFNDFVGNEAYAVPNGLTVWWLCTTFETPHPGCSSNLDSFQVWHHHRWGYYGYETSNLTLDNFVIRGDVDRLTNRFEPVQGFEFSDYLQHNLLVSNADIQNVNEGLRLPTFRDVRNATGPNDGVNVFEDLYVVATEGIGVWAPSSVNGEARDLAAQTSVIRNVQFEYPRVGSPDGERAHIRISDTSLLLDDTKTNYDVRNDVFVENYNRAPGVDGDDFYIVPGYQGPGRCDSNIGNCGLDLTARYSEIEQGHIFALAGDTVGPTSSPPVENEVADETAVEDAPGNEPSADETLAANNATENEPAEDTNQPTVSFALSARNLLLAATLILLLSGGLAALSTTTS